MYLSLHENNKKKLNTISFLGYNHESDRIIKFAKVVEYSLALK